MPIISSKLSAHLIDSTEGRATWAEIDLTVSTTFIITKMDAILEKEISTSTSLDARLIDSDLTAEITTSLDAVIISPTTRSITDSLAAALSQDELEVFFALDLLFDSGDLFLWTGLGDKVINGNTYIGTGTLLSISEVEETSEIAAKGAELVLSGIPSEILALALTEPYQGRECNLYFGVVSDTTEMTEVFSGIMDRMDILETGQTCTITLGVENKLVDLERPKLSRYTSAYQQIRYPNDKGFNFVEDLQDKKLTWGRKPG